MNGSEQARLFELEEYRSAKPAETSSADADQHRSDDQYFQLRLVVGPQELVEEFHLAFGLPVSSTPNADISAPLADLRKRLLHEEVSELVSAIDGGDLRAIAGELADVIYVVYGTALTYGIDLDAAVTEIHASNMSKLDPEGNPIVRRDGKVLKGPSYQLPDLDSVLRASSKPRAR